MREPIRDRERLLHIDDAINKLIQGTAERLDDIKAVLSI